MINIRLLNLVEGAKKYIYLNVLFQIIGLLCNVVFLLLMSQWLVEGRTTVVLLFCIVPLRMLCHYLSNWMSHLSSARVKIELREMLFTKVLLLGTKAKEIVSDSELVQLSGEGIEQLELYFSNYIPQFFYSMLAPLILFVFVITKQLSVALVLLVCVPLIPMSIVFVQRFAKKLLNKYWGIYTGLGDSFLDSLQGLLTLKLFNYDKVKQVQLEEQSETFRKITMRVLLMQLNSISVMDLVAYGGAMLAIIIAVYAKMELASFLFVILICAEFFIPMRLLGSYFHVAMNGSSAADKVFKILDFEYRDIEEKELIVSQTGYAMQNLSFQYTDTPVLRNINFKLNKGEFVGLVGASGSGKSTLSNLLMKHLNHQDITFASQNLEEVRIQNYVCRVAHDAVIFKGSVRDLLLSDDDVAMQSVLDKLNLPFALDDSLDYLGNNVSGGERQRLALARALLKDVDFYIFDEITSAVDYESEAIIIKVIQDLVAKGKGVLLISHRLLNVFNCDRIYVLEQGICIGEGSHQDLMKSLPTYQEMVSLQEKFEVSL